MENCQPSAMRQVAKELKDLVQHPPEGIRLLVNEANMADIQAHIDGPVDTPYHGGRFHVRLLLGPSYPAEPPKGYFVTKIFHPNIAPQTGEICVNTLKRDWSPDTGIKKLLLVIKCLLIVPNPESALNEEAGKLLLEEYSEYFNRARLFTEIHAPKQLLESPSDCPTVLKDTNDNTGSASGAGSAASAAVGAASSVGASAAGGLDKKRTDASTAAKCKAKKALKRL